MEKELYYKLSDNADLGELHLRSLQEVIQHIDMDLGDIHPKERESVFYTIQPVYMTEDEFNNLPEYDG